MAFCGGWNFGPVLVCFVLGGEWLMGRSASQKARREWHGPSLEELSRETPRPSFESFQRKKPQFDDEFGSVEDFKNGAAANDAMGSGRVLGCDETDESDPDAAKNDVRDSGIRENDKDKAPDEGPLSERVDDPALSFRAYTIADLEKEGKPISIRPTRYSIVAEAQKPATGTMAHLGEIAFAGGNLLHACFAWLRGPGPRPKLADALRAPWVAFAAEIRRGIKALNWKKLSIGVAIGATTLLVLLLVVLTAAELTDDLKPARASGVQTTTASVKTIGLQNEPDPSATVVAPAPIAPAAAPTAEPASDETIEIDDAPATTTQTGQTGKKAAAPRPAAKPRLPAPRAPKGKVKSGDPFVP